MFQSKDAEGTLNEAEAQINEERWPPEVIGINTERLRIICVEGQKSENRKEAYNAPGSQNPAEKCQSVSLQAAYMESCTGANGGTYQKDGDRKTAQCTLYHQDAEFRPQHQHTQPQ
jgi:hypothetical protein